MYNLFQHLTASQGTAVETLRAQLAEANERINKLSADMHERKSGYKHSQLEELRNLQTTVQKEKQDWERHKAKELQMMEAERAQLEEMRSILAKQEVYDISDKDIFNTHYDKKKDILCYCTVCQYICLFNCQQFHSMHTRSPCTIATFRCWSRLRKVLLAKRQMIEVIYSDASLLVLITKFTFNSTFLTTSGQSLY